MILAIIGSRNLKIEEMERYLPQGVTEIVTGGARGIDTQAQTMAEKQKIKLTVFLPQYPRYGRGAPLKRNEQIVDHADAVLAFWDSTSKGTQQAVAYAKKQNKPVRVYLFQKSETPSCAE